MNSKEVPIGVKVISVLYYIGSAFGLLMTLLLLAGAGLFASFTKKSAFFGTGILIVFALVVLALSVLSFFIAKDLWKAKPWARIAAIVLNIMGAIYSIIVIIMGSFLNIVHLILYIVIAAYLLFSEEVKKVFEQ